MNVEDIEIAARFRGPPNSGNGGYVCGLLAKGLRGTVSVRLKAPPPLNTPLRREWTHDTARLLSGATLIGEAKTAELELVAPDPPGLDGARQAAASYPGFTDHVFPHCFVCGPRRRAGDGLRIFAGRLPGGAVHMAPWETDASLAGENGRVAPEFIWAALDCPSGFAVLPIPQGSAIVLGELCATLHGELRVGETAVVSAWPIAQEGRRRVAGSAIHAEDGRLVALGKATWIEVPANQWTGTAEERSAPRAA